MQIISSAYAMATFANAEQRTLDGFSTNEIGSMTATMKMD